MHGMTLSLDLLGALARQRVGGVGVKNSNPDRPDALISDPNNFVFFLKCSLDPSETSALRRRGSRFW